jgi:hypothetical protein
MELTGDAIPAVLFGAVTTFGVVWKVVDFMRDKRVKRAEADAETEHERYVLALSMNQALQAEVYRLKLQSGEKPS